MNILADFHHRDLWWSLQLLADRMGATLYRPWGMEWYDQGLCKLYGDLSKQDPDRYLAKKYLVDTIFDTGESTAIGTATMNGCIDFPKFNTLTVEQMKDTKLDIIICSVHENEQWFYKLKQYNPNAKFIRHVGNDLDGNVDVVKYPNLLASALTPFNTFDCHKILYRQEFDMNLFKPTAIRGCNNIYTFQGGLEYDEQAYSIWVELQQSLRAFKFKEFGVGNMGGFIYEKRQYIETLLNASFVYQVKDNEGYGHVLHNAIHMGRPPLIYKHQYKDKLLGPLLEDEKTCLYIEDTLEATVNKINKWAKPDKLDYLRKCATARFAEVVNFDNEYETRIKPFFEQLI